MPDIFDRLAARPMGTASRKPDIFDRVAAMPRTDIGDDSDDSYDQDPLSPSPRRTTGLETGARFDTSPLYGAGAASFGDKPFAETSLPQAAKGAGKALAAQSLGLLREGLKAGPGGEAIWALGDILARRRGIPEPSTFPIAQAFGLQPKTEDEATGAIMAEAGSLGIPPTYGVPKLSQFLKAKRATEAAKRAKLAAEARPAPLGQGVSGAENLTLADEYKYYESVRPPPAWAPGPLGRSGAEQLDPIGVSGPALPPDIRSRFGAKYGTVAQERAFPIPGEPSARRPYRGEARLLGPEPASAPPSAQPALTPIPQRPVESVPAQWRQPPAEPMSGPTGTEFIMPDRRQSLDALAAWLTGRQRERMAVVPVPGGRPPVAPYRHLPPTEPRIPPKMLPAPTGSAGPPKMLPAPTGSAGPPTLPPIVPRGTSGGGPIPHTPGVTKDVTPPRFAYRVRDVGEQGVPSADHAQASMSEADVRRMAPSRTEAPQEVVKVNLDKLTPDDFTIYPRKGEAPWVKFNREMGETDVERVGAITDADVLAAQKAAPALRQAVADAGSRPEEIMGKTGLSERQAAKGVEDVRRDAMHEFSPEAVQVKRAVLESGGGGPPSAPARQEASMVANQRGSVTLPALPVRPKPGEGVSIRVPSPSNRRLLEKVLDILPGLRSPGERLKSKEGKEVFEAIQELDQHTLPKWNQFTDKWIDEAFAPLRPSGIKRFLSAEARQGYAAAKEKIRAALEGEIPVESLSSKERGAYNKLDQFRNKYAKAFGLEEGRFFSSYFPHVFKGRYQVKLIAPDGGAKTIPGGFADTLRAGTTLGEEFMAANPDLLAKGYKTVIEEAKREGGEGIAAFSHLLKREANLTGYAKDPEKIWRQYGHGGNRKLLADKMMKQIYPAYQRLPPEEREIADGLLKYVFGETPKVDRVVDGVIRDMGLDIAPHLASKVAGTARTFYFVTKLGLYNAGSAALNHTQVLTFGLAKLGPKYLAEGYNQYLFGGDKANTLLRKSGVLLEETRAGSQIEDLTGWVKSAAEKTTAPFQIVERGNRGIVYLGGRQKWLDAHPGDYRGADRYGKEINTDVNFNQGKSGRQSLLRDPTAHTVLQFKNYMLKAVEAFAKMNGREKALFIASTLAIGGPTAAPFIKYLTDTSEDGAAVVDALNRYTNVPRMVGMSFEHDAGVGFLPSSPIELLGPGGQAVYGLGERGMRAGVGDWPRKYQVDLWRNVRPTMLARAGQFLDSAEGDWRTFDREGRPVTQSTPGGALANFLLGSRSREWADRATTQRRMAAIIGRASEQKHGLALRMVQALRAGEDTSGIQAEIAQFNAENHNLAPPISNAYLQRLNREFDVDKMERLDARRRELAGRVAP